MTMAVGSGVGEHSQLLCDRGGMVNSEMNWIGGV